jgi:DNA-binding NarL/FixJ family response regulator
VTSWQISISMTKIFIIDDHNVVIEGILSLLQNLPEITVCGYAQTAATSIDFLEKNEVDIILMDINLPDMSGLDLCKTVKQTYPAIKTLALTTFNQISYINKMMTNGASGYLLKNISKDELIEAIETVMTGNIYHSFEVNEIIKTSKSNTANLPILTKRETDILKLVAEGLTNPQIGEKLFISPDTVDSHRKNLHTKLGVNNTALLVRYAIEHGLG